MTLYPGIEEQHREVDIQVQCAAEALDQGDGAGSGGLVREPGLANEVRGQLTLIGSAYLAFRYMYLYDPPYRAPGSVNSRLAAEFQELLYVFPAQQWSVVEDYLGDIPLVMIVLEIAGNVLLMVTVLFLAVMFFTRRHTFPRFFITYMWFAITVQGADLLAISLLSYPGVEVTSKDSGELVGQVISAIVWSPYFTRSERVKATFTRQLKHKEPVTFTAGDEGEVVPQHTG